ncbi:retroviral-like aspartic protease family protein [Caulobacter mirabilis]|uniref:Peptidase A2 domain-containing protein n=1 Tax=Caulobacter mirabilis TaxID=69666 RepID=A0A2D2AXA5_9CAUL|nr:aspartyl protease family protein [Caulobacter mirabilis]ATQ42611.1 hypothetical protein CSW64_09425 [Caulobacter mirabilis]
MNRTLHPLIAAAALLIAVQAQAACLPIERGDGDTPIVLAKVDGQGPFAFVLDTAASGSTVDPALAEQLKAPRDAATETAEGLGGPMDVRLHRIASFQAGPAAIRDFTAPAIPAPAFESHPVRGLAGIDLFGQSLAVWTPNAACVDLRAAGAAPGDGWRRVEANWIRPWKVMLPIRVGEVEGWGLLDTGAQWTVLNPAFAARLGLQAGSPRLRPAGEISGVDGRPMPLSAAEVSAVSVGAWRWDARTLRTGDLPVFARLGDPTQPLAVIGIDWLKDASFAVDYRDAVVWQR